MRKAESTASVKPIQKLKLFHLSMARTAVLTVEFLLELSTLKDVLPTPLSNTQTKADVGQKILITEPDQKKKEELNVTTIG